MDTDTVNNSPQSFLSLVLPQRVKIFTAALAFSGIGLFYPGLFPYERSVALRLGSINSELFESPHILLMKTDPRTVCGSPFGLYSVPGSRCVVSFGPERGTFLIRVKADSTVEVDAGIERVVGFYDSEYGQYLGRNVERAREKARALDLTINSAAGNKPSGFLEQLLAWELTKQKMDISAAYEDPTRTYPNSLVFDSGAVETPVLVPRITSMAFFMLLGAFSAVFVLLLLYLNGKYGKEA